MRGKRNRKQFEAKEQFFMLISKRSMAVIGCLAIFVGATAASMAIETTLGGIRLGAPGSDVLKRYGNPTRITVNYVGVAGADPNAPGGAAGASNPGGGAPSAGNALGALGAIGSYYNTASNLASDPNAPILPSVGGLGMPGPAPAGPIGAPGTPNGPGPNTEQQITWTYDRGQTTLEFIISDKGLVIQITAGGAGKFELAKTTKGVKFGWSYKDVLLKYGFPESQAKVGKFVRASYADKDHVVFTFLKEKVVGITIALKLDD